MGYPNPHGLDTSLSLSKNETDRNIFRRIFFSQKPWFLKLFLFFQDLWPFFPESNLRSPKTDCRGTHRDGWRLFHLALDPRSKSVGFWWLSRHPTGWPWALGKNKTYSFWWHICIGLDWMWIANPLTTETTDWALQCHAWKTLESWPARSCCAPGSYFRGGKPFCKGNISSFHRDFERSSIVDSHLPFFHWI